MTGRSGPSVGRDDILKQMLDYSLSTFYPHIKEKFPEPCEEMYLLFYKEVSYKHAQTFSYRLFLMFKT